MPEQVPFQTETRRARQRSVAGEAPYPAVASSSSQIQDSSPRAALSASRLSQAAHVSQDSTATSGSSRESMLEPSIFQQRIPEDMLHPLLLSTAGTVISSPVLGPVTHNTDSRPFLSPVFRSQPSVMLPADNIFLPMMPSSPLEQVFPRPLRPTTPTLPTLGMPFHQRNEIFGEADITEQHFEDIEAEDANSSVFSDGRYSRSDSQILFPELEANHFQFQNPAAWSFPSRPRNPNRLCRSQLCPIRAIPHGEGLFLFEGQESSHPNLTFGRSNPPPFVWTKYLRILNSCDEQEDRLAAWAFAYCHHA